MTKLRPKETPIVLAAIARRHGFHTTIVEDVVCVEIPDTTAVGRGSEFFSVTTYRELREVLGY